MEPGRRERPRRASSQCLVRRPRSSRSRVPAVAREWGDERTGVRRPALSQLLLILIEKAGLTRVRPDDEQRWVDAVDAPANGIEIAPGRLLYELWFPRVSM